MSNQMSSDVSVSSEASEVPVQTRVYRAPPSNWRASPATAAASSGFVEGPRSTGTGAPAPAQPAGAADGVSTSNQTQSVQPVVQGPVWRPGQFQSQSAPAAGGSSSVMAATALTPTLPAASTLLTRLKPAAVWRLVSRTAMAAALLTAVYLVFRWYLVRRQQRIAVEAQRRARLRTEPQCPRCQEVQAEDRRLQTVVQTKLQDLRETQSSRLATQVKELEREYNELRDNSAGHRYGAVAMVSLVLDEWRVLAVQADVMEKKITKLREQLRTVKRTAQQHTIVHHDHSTVDDVELQPNSSSTATNSSVTSSQQSHHETELPDLNSNAAQSEAASNKQTSRHEDNNNQQPEPAHHNSNEASTSEGVTLSTANHDRSSSAGNSNHKHRRKRRSSEKHK